MSYKEMLNGLPLSSLKDMQKDLRYRLTGVEVEIRKARKEYAKERIEVARQDAFIYIDSFAHDPRHKSAEVMKEKMRSMVKDLVDESLKVIAMVDRSV
jgi:hypothetical protein